MGFCIVRGCKSRSDCNNRGRKFHTVPRDIEMREKWIAAIGRSNLPKSGSVCSRHFLPADYQLSRSGLSESLSKTAVPSQHLVPPIENDSDNEDNCPDNNGDDVHLNPYYSAMEFERETSFDGFTTAIDALEMEKEKDLPRLTCVDLFPDPPRLLTPKDELHKDDSLADDDDFEGFRTLDIKTDDDQPDLIDDDLTQSSNQQPQQPIKYECIGNIQSPTNKNNDEQAPISATPTISLPSAPVSPASYFSSAESVTSSASSSTKSKKRYCRACNIHFRKTRELHEHLKKHIAQPEIRVERLSDDHKKVKEYLSFLREKPSPTHGSLKLKLKQLGSQNFEVISNEKESKRPSTAENSQAQVLKAADIRCKSEPESISGSYSQDTTTKLEHSFLAPENRYFECPTFDGLDTFTEEMLNTGEATEDLLKKLLENNKEPQSFQKEPDWPPGANEFISIDSLAPRCSVCNMNSSHPNWLYEHKRLTGHDFQTRTMDSMTRPPGPPDYGSVNRLDNYMPPSHPPPQIMPPLYHMAQMRGNFTGYNPRLNVRQMLHHPQPSPPPGFHPAHCMMSRTPPPLYRMNGNPPHYPPPAHRYLEKRPDMFGPSAPQFLNGNQEVNQDMMRQPIFLKSRLQKAVRGKSQGPTNEIPTSSGILTHHTAIRPRFLGPNPPMPGHMQFQRIRARSPPKQDEPSSKKTKMEQNNTAGPVIQSVHSGVNTNDFVQMDDKTKGSSPTHSDGTAKGLSKNPKDVANILATRGITVTHKGKTSIMPVTNKGVTSANASAQEAVQKLQANNSVSIISKKKASEQNAGTQSPPDPGSDNNRGQVTTKFLSCPVITCKEMFLTPEGVNRHAFRWHGIPMPNPDRFQKRAIRCKLCNQVCASPEILQEHMRREHEPSMNEIGIPIVDLRNEDVKKKLAGLGIFNYVPLTAAGASTSSLAFPVVSVQGAGNPSVCNLLGLGASSVLSLGPIKSITMRKPSNDNK